MSEEKKEVKVKAKVKVKVKEKLSKAVPKSNASQKIQALEDVILSYNQKFDILAEELDFLKTQVQAVAKRLNAAISAAEGGALTNDSVAKLIIEDNVKELKAKVEYLVQQKVLEVSESGEITERTFVVGREVSKNGDEVNPRIQFAMPALQDSDLKGKLLGVKAGEIVKPDEEDGLSLEISEVYNIVEQKVEKKFNEEATPE